MPDIIPSTNASPSTALAIPDPRVATVPIGWATTTFAPLVEERTWEELDEAEARLLGLASYIQGLDGDHLELQKALRIVEYRRGLMLAPAQGKRTDLNTASQLRDTRVAKLTASPEEAEQVHRKTAERYRTIAAFWSPIVWPHLLEADRVSDVTQAAILRLIRNKNAPEPEPKPTEGASDLTPEELAEFGAEPEVDVGAELDLALKEIERLEALVETLSATDRGTELRTWVEKYARLEGRVTQLARTAAEAEKQAKWQGNALRKIRQTLQVEKSSEIMPALLRLVNAG